MKGKEVEHLDGEIIVIMNKYLGIGIYVDLQFLYLRKYFEIFKIFVEIIRIEKFSNLLWIIF